MLRNTVLTVRTLTGPDATKVTSNDALNGLLKGRRKDVVLVGFAGHGTQMNLLDDEGIKPGPRRARPGPLPMPSSVRSTRSWARGRP